jgi:anti-sigma-K factor RskA
MAMAANKVDGVRAAPAQSEDEVRMTREHNDANVLTLGAKYLDEEPRARSDSRLSEHGLPAAGTRAGSRRSRQWSGANHPPRPEGIAVKAAQRRVV